MIDYSDYSSFYLSEYVARTDKRKEDKLEKKKKTSCKWIWNGNLWIVVYIVII